MGAAFAIAVRIGFRILDEKMAQVHHAEIAITIALPDLRRRPFPQKGSFEAVERKATILECCIEINRLENEADLISLSAVVNLFHKEKEPITLMFHIEFERFGIQRNSNG